MKVHYTGQRDHTYEAELIFEFEDWAIFRYIEFFETPEWAHHWCEGRWNCQIVWTEMPDKTSCICCGATAPKHVVTMLRLLKG